MTSCRDQPTSSKYLPNVYFLNMGWAHELCNHLASRKHFEMISSNIGQYEEKKSLGRKLVIYFGVYVATEASSRRFQVDFLKLLKPLLVSLGTRYWWAKMTCRMPKNFFPLNGFFSITGTRCRCDTTGTPLKCYHSLGLASCVISFWFTKNFVSSRFCKSRKPLAAC